MARNMSLFSPLIAAKRKNGRETKIAVDASGSECLRLKYNAILTINNEINRKVVYRISMGKVRMSPLSSS